MNDAVYTARLTRAADALSAARAACRKRKARQARRRFDAALRLISLDGFVAWINRDAQGFELMGADEWRRTGVTSAVQLGKVLDAEVERERRKDALDWGDDEPDSDEPADYDDGQPDELQEWHDYDPDC